MHTNRKAWLAGVAALALLLGTALMIRDDAAAAADSSKGGDVWGADYFPNLPLINHQGESVRFFDDLVKGKVVAINFIYTSCPDACPMETARLLEVQKILGDRVGKDIFFYSITIDPEYDTPEVLQEYVKRFDLGPGWWFLTGKEQDIISLRKKFGVYIEEIQSPDSNDHNLSLVIGNQSTGRWMKRSPYENPYILAKQLGGELHNWKVPSQVKRDYDQAPELRNISTGESLFRTRCASCHTIGQGDIFEMERRLVGPDLFNVTKQRDRKWLERWLAEPDKMLEEKDPLAMALLAQYKNVPMPNFRLNALEVEALLSYLDEESQRIQSDIARGSSDHSDRSGLAGAPDDQPANADNKAGKQP